MVADPALAWGQAEVESPEFRAGTLRGYWKKEEFSFPKLIIWVQGTEPDQSHKWYRFRFELDGCPGRNPACFFIHPQTGNLIDNDADRPKIKGGAVNDSFKGWGNGVYRPWERMGTTHLHSTPTLTWNPSRRLTFALEDIY